MYRTNIEEAFFNQDTLHKLGVDNWESSIIIILLALCSLYHIRMGYYLIDDSVIVAIGLV